MESHPGGAPATLELSSRVAFELLASSLARAVYAKRMALTIPPRYDSRMQITDKFIAKSRLPV